MVPRSGSRSARPSGLEAEHARSAHALSSGFLVQHLSADTAPDEARRPVLRGRAVHRQRRKRPAAGLSRAVDEQSLLLVAAAGRYECPADRRRWNRARPRALRPDGAGILAPVLGVSKAQRTVRSAMAAIEVANHRCDPGEHSRGSIAIRSATRLTAAGTSSRAMPINMRFVSHN